ncbi:ABC transporter substrate-binding protein [uncultured Modestobacter sp.]|uniref:ABC transporter substrate-binding protein n=1 Tax=uncultured Modestobacter sp. TaxID=380048 RepID=UPI002639555B|nr:ABC transporter substrate-binding protein [uncultured Modestobacter sp.]
MGSTNRTPLIRSLAALSALALPVSLAACSSGDTETAAGPEEIRSVGLLVQDMSNPFFSAMDRALDEVADEQGLTANTQDAQLDLGTQTTQMDAFIQQGVDLVIVSAVDQDGIEPAILRAKQAGIIVIAVDTPAVGADAVVETNAVQAGETSCTYLFEQMGGEGNVLLVDGTPIQTIIDRIEGCRNVASEYPGISIVGQQSSENDRASGLAVTTDMLTATPDVQGIFGMNDPSALGAVLAVEQAGRPGVLVTGVDGSPEAVEELQRAGSPFIGTATQAPGEMVRTAIDLAEQLVAGEELEEDHVLIPSELVTRDDVDEYAGW